MTLRIKTVDYYRQLAVSEPYWIGRDAYISVALDFLHMIEATLSMESALEIGANGHALIENCDTLDLNPNTQPTFIHDARITPWKGISDNAYDVLVALQTWEHLGHSQIPAFREARRISKFQVMSFPLNWKNPKDFTHYGVTRELIGLWTDNVQPIAQCLVPNDPNQDFVRMVALYGR